MVPIRQRDPASPGQPLTHTPAQQGLEDAELPGSFPGQALQAIFGKQGTAWWGIPVPARARLSQTRTPHAPTLLSLTAGACLPLLGSHTHGGPGVS